MIKVLAVCDRCSIEWEPEPNVQHCYSSRLYSSWDEVFTDMGYYIYYNLIKHQFALCPFCRKQKNTLENEFSTSRNEAIKSWYGNKLDHRDKSDPRLIEWIEKAEPSNKPSLFSRIFRRK